MFALKIVWLSFDLKYCLIKVLLICILSILCYILFIETLTIVIQIPKKIYSPPVLAILHPVSVKKRSSTLIQSTTKNYIHVYVCS